jgi:hypothetical protein
MADALQSLEVGFDRRRQPVVEHLLKHVILGQALSLMPDESPGESTRAYVKLNCSD